VDLDRGESFGFLGFDFRRMRGLRGVWRAHYTPKLKKRTALLRKLKDVFRRHQSQPIDRVVSLINPAAVANQAKPLRRVTPSRRSKVCRSSRSWFTNRALAHVRTSDGPTSPTQRLFRAARSSPNLCARPSLTRSNRRGTDPYARWCGRGGAARHRSCANSGHVWTAWRTGQIDPQRPYELGTEPSNLSRRPFVNRARSSSKR